MRPQRRAFPSPSRANGLWYAGFSDLDFLPETNHFLCAIKEIPHHFFTRRGLAHGLQEVGEHPKVRKSIVAEIKDATTSDDILFSEFRWDTAIRETHLRGEARDNRDGVGDRDGGQARHLFFEAVEIRP